MTVLMCMVSEDDRRGQWQNENMDTFKGLLPIAMGQLAGALYDWVEEWEPEDLARSIAEDVEYFPSVIEMNGKVFTK